MALVNLPIASLAVLLAALAAAPACAQHGRRGMPPDDAERGLMIQRQRERQGMQPMPPEYGRMSSEERRQLRRDIHDAGRELYRPQGRRFRADERDPAASR